VSGRVRLTKNGEPLEVFAPAEGILGRFKWWPAHRDACIARGSAFPAYKRPWGSHGALSKSPGFEERGIMTGDQMRAGVCELLGLLEHIGSAEAAAIGAQGQDRALPPPQGPKLA